jgi:hypothetical protein
VIITGIGQKFLDKHGKDKAIEVVGKSSAAIARWVNGLEPTVGDLQRLIDFDPSLISPNFVQQVNPPAIELGQGVYSAPEKEEPVGPRFEWPTGKFLDILIVANQGIEPDTMLSLMKQWEPDKMDIRVQAETLPIYARNKLSAQFLEGGKPWSFWLDRDIVLPCGDVAWFRQATGNPAFPAPFAKLNTLARLMSDNRKIVGGCYFGRHPGAHAQFNEAHTNKLVDSMVHSGPRNVVEKTRWIANGCMLVHRDIYLDIIKTQGEQIRIKDVERQRALGYTYRFFTPQFDDEDLADNSEDVSFCARVEKTGLHDIYVDHAIVPGHIGKTAYSYHNTSTKRSFVF